MIRSDPTYDDFRQWQVPPSHDWLMQRWRLGRCSILFSARTDNARDVIRLSDVAKEAAAVIILCIVHSQQKLGGHTAVGPMGEFEVIVVHA